MQITCYQLAQHRSRVIADVNQFFKLQPSEDMCDSLHDLAQTSSLSHLLPTMQPILQLDSLSQGNAYTGDRHVTL